MFELYGENDKSLFIADIWFNLNTFVRSIFIV